MTARTGAIRLPVTLLRKKVQDFYRHLPKALGGNEEAIHQLRVAGRRLRVALPHLAARPRGKRVRRALAEIQEITRTAGETRDRDVILHELEAALPPEEARAKEQTRLLRRLRADRERHHGAMAMVVLEIGLARLRRQILRILERGDPGPEVVRVALRRMQRRQALTFLEDKRALGVRFDPARLHELRIAARRLRYAAELQGVLEGAEPAFIDGLKDLQDALGRIRDTYLAATWFRDEAARASLRGLPALVREARRQQRHFRRLCGTLHRTFLEQRPDARMKAILGAVEGAPSKEDIEEGNDHGAADRAARHRGRGGDARLHRGEPPSDQGRRGKVSRGRARAGRAASRS
jgi:CHAD domain-containing protein